MQRPGEKINHALVLGGPPGIGKDTALEPVKRAVGPWNFQEVSPVQVMGRFNGFLKSVILRISEARDLGEFDRYKFYDHLKTYTAAPPDMLRVDEKHVHEHMIVNCTGVIITTNRKTDGIFLPEDDRRHFVAWSDLSKEDFTPDYWNTLWGWYEDGGFDHVAAFLAGLNIESFDPKAPPKKTAAFYAIADAGCAPEESELADVLDLIGNPKVTTLARIIEVARDGGYSIYEWLKEIGNHRTIPHRLEKCEYVPVRSDTAKDGRWKLNGTRQVIHAKKGLSLSQRLEAARALVQETRPASGSNDKGGA